MNPPDGEVRPALILAIVGPTASGKSGFALEAAERFGGEILSCDSMAVYRGLDIGTAKPSPADQQRVRHHLLDVAEPGSFFSAGAFRAAARECMAGMAARGKACVLVGGTGLYYRALTQGLADLPPRDESLRERLTARVERRGAASLHKILSRFDPLAAARIMPADTVRTVRALEVRLLTRRPISSWIETSPFGCAGLPGILKIGLTASRTVLYERIEARVDAMMAAGLLREVEGLHRWGRLTGAARKAIGYGELADHIAGSCTLGEAVARIKLRSRHLAKRQITWFRKETGVKWYYIDAREAWKNDAMDCIERWRQETRQRP